MIIILILSSLMFLNNLAANEAEYTFPKKFRFGVASSAYQVEGAWNESGKGESIWDNFCHTYPDKINGRVNGDIASDAYHNTKGDVKLLSDLKVDLYRFCISWSRLLPEGFSYKVNPDGVRYYNELIDALLERNITPLVSIYHWDLPQKLQELGGWANPLIEDWFADYANVVFELFGDRVKEWISINEPNQICQQGYAEGARAPGYENKEMGGYLCGHNLLLAHAKVYHLYQKEYKHKQKGRIGFTVSKSWIQPLTKSPADAEAAERAAEMTFNWFGHPVFSTAGDYPKMMRERVDRFSKEEGFPRSRLPKFTPEEVKFIRGSFDFLGLNHYVTEIVRDGADNASRPSYSFDGGFTYANKMNLTLLFQPDGILKSLEWIKREYNNPEVIITENGYPGFDEVYLNDCNKIKNYNEYLQEVLKAIYESGVRVTAYSAWSFLDDFEWTRGHSLRFGLHYVNFTDPQRERIPRMSSHVYRNIIETKKIDWSFTPDGFPQCQWN